MIEISLEEIALITGARMAEECPEIAFTSLSTDTRTAQPGELFIAIQGPSFDGHNYLVHAAQNGCPAVIVEQPVSGVPEGCIVLTVRSSRHALGLIARYVRDAVNPAVIAVTGSNGKTTTKEMIRHILEGDRPTVSSQGNFNNEIGLPKSLLRIHNRAEVAVVELGSNRPGEIERLAEIARPNIGVVTNVSAAHLEGLGDEAGVAKEKSCLLKAICPDGLSVINLDCQHAHLMLRAAQSKTATFAIETEAHFRATTIRQVGTELTFRINTTPFEVPGLGQYNVYNSLAAVAACSGLGIDLEFCAQRLLTFSTLAQRMEVIENNEQTLLNDCYNANPESMNAALKSLAAFRPERIKVAILGDMLELGELSDFLHGEIGRSVIEAGVDTLWTVGGLANEIAVDAVRRGMKPESIRCFVNASDCAQHMSQLPPDGVILIKGSRDMAMEKITEVLLAKSPTGIGLKTNKTKV